MLILHWWRFSFICFLNYFNILNFYINFINPKNVNHSSASPLPHPLLPHPLLPKGKASQRGVNKAWHIKLKQDLTAAFSVFWLLKFFWYNFGYVLWTLGVQELCCPLFSCAWTPDNLFLCTMYITLLCDMLYNTATLYTSIIRSEDLIWLHHM